MLWVVLSWPRYWHTRKGVSVMPRDIPVGNGRLLVCFDRDYCIRDIYYPHVGQENHGAGQTSRFGIWVDGRFSWVGEGWDRALLYQTDTLVTEVSLSSRDLGVALLCRDAVDFDEDLYLRVISVKNLAARPREIRLFLHLCLGISGNTVGDTAAFDPTTGGVVHYKGARYFLVNGQVDGTEGLDQFATGQTGTDGKIGTFKDAEDGRLSGNPIAQGSVDAVIGLKMILAPMEERKAYFWMVAAQSWEALRQMDALVKQKHPEKLLERTADYWRLWVRKESPPLSELPNQVAELYKRSLLILRSQTDWQGGILAGNDSDVIQFNRDTYSYIWPRDGALVSYSLDLAGYPGLSRNFFRFMAERLDPEGYLLHKYNPDGTLASSWHPWYQKGRTQLPIQEDSTALVVWALWHHFVMYRDIEFVKPLYAGLIKRAAEFMCAYREGKTGLPAPSYDLWEERYGISAFTVGAVFGGLTAASLFCKLFGEEQEAERYRAVAAQIRDAASLHLWRPALGRFCRILYLGDDGELKPDGICDASLWGLFAFGMYSANDPRVASSISKTREKLWVKTKVGGMARYEGDTYHQKSEQLPGNPWVICTLWLADFLLERGESEEELNQAKEILLWAASHALPSGVLPEQLHPVTGEPLSVSPLTWSHAAFVATTHRLLRRMARSRICPTCGSPSMPYIRRDDWIEKLYTTTCESIHGLCKV